MGANCKDSEVIEHDMDATACIGVCASPSIRLLKCLIYWTHSLKGKNKATAFHFYPESGELKFSNSKYPPVVVGSNAGEIKKGAAGSEAQGQPETTSDTSTCKPLGRPSRK